jgi:voltage-gated sodium channel
MLPIVVIVIFCSNTHTLNNSTVAISTGLSLDGYHGSGVEKFDLYVANITFYVFVFEVVIKIISFGDKPYIYFVDKGGNGVFNCFDFVLSALSIALVGQSSAGAIRTLRLARLVRLLTIIKNVPELKVIVIGLIAGLRSVVYIVALLILVIYLYAVLGVIVLSDNDRANFGDVPLAMMTLFQVSTLTSWTTLAYVNWHGCDTYSNGYVQVDDDRELLYAPTETGRLPTWQCLQANSQPIFTFIYFTSFTIIAAMVIMVIFLLQYMYF